MSTPSSKERRLTPSTKATAIATTNESAVTKESGNNHGGGGVGVGGVDTSEINDRLNRSVVEDNIWDIDSMASDYKKSTYLIHKRPKKAPSTDTPLVTYSKRHRKTPSKSAQTTRLITTAPVRPSSSLVKTTTPAKVLTPPSSPKQRIETPAQLLTRLQKMPVS